MSATRVPHIGMHVNLVDVVIYNHGRIREVYKVGSVCDAGVVEADSHSGVCGLPTEQTEGNYTREMVYSDAYVV